MEKKEEKEEREEREERREGREGRGGRVAKREKEALMVWERGEKKDTRIHKVKANRD